MLSQIQVFKVQGTAVKDLKRLCTSRSEWRNRFQTLITNCTYSWDSWSTLLFRFLDSTYFDIIVFLSVCYVVYYYCLFKVYYPHRSVFLWVNHLKPKYATSMRLKLNPPLPSLPWLVDAPPLSDLKTQYGSVAEQREEACCRFSITSEYYTAFRAFSHNDPSLSFLLVRVCPSK